MTTALISHTDCLGHVTPPGHPERVDRLKVVMSAFETEEFAYLVRVDAPLAENAWIERVHPAAPLSATGRAETVARGRWPKGLRTIAPTQSRNSWRGGSISMLATSGRSREDRPTSTE